MVSRPTKIAIASLVGAFVILFGGWTLYAWAVHAAFRWECSFDELGRRLALSDGLQAVQVEINCGATTSFYYWVVAGRDLSEETYRDNLVVSLEAPARIAFEQGSLLVDLGGEEPFSSVDEVHGIEVRYIRSGE